MYPERLHKFINPEEQIKEWKTSDKQVLLCGQANLGRCKAYKSLDDWYGSIKTKTKNLDFRPHPNHGKAVALKKQLLNIKSAIVLNSTVAVEILMEGELVIATHEGNTVYGICGNTIDDIKYNKRIPLLQYIAQCQRYSKETKNGRNRKTLN